VPRKGGEGRFVVEAQRSCSKSFEKVRRGFLVEAMVWAAPTGAALRTYDRQG